MFLIFFICLYIRRIFKDLLYIKVFMCVVIKCLVYIYLLKVKDVCDMVSLKS